MTPSNMAHQRAQDDAAEIEFRAEELEQEAREKLLGLLPVRYVEKVGIGVVANSKTSWDVMEAAYDLGENEIELAFSLLDKDDLEAVRILKEVRAKAVEDVLGRIDFEQIVTLSREQAQRERAA
ncbi:hypothetical protein [Marinobacter alexandrii]|uniref:hypothetical protein n=1 Tax=Marinobacter alexandrii TaxID=2570351 RepID=UPI0011095302|nr:hypothetical protein [Marinobacter alexandrii]